MYLPRITRAACITNFKVDGNCGTKFDVTKFKIIFEPENIILNVVTSSFIELKNHSQLCYFNFIPSKSFKLRNFKLLCPNTKKVKPVEAAEFDHFAPD